MALRNYGGTWEAWEDDLTMPRLEGMLEELFGDKGDPPVYLILKAVHGIGKAEGGGEEMDQSSRSGRSGVVSGLAAIEALSAMSPGGNLDTMRVFEMERK